MNLFNVFSILPYRALTIHDLKFVIFLYFYFYVIRCYISWYFEVSNPVLKTAARISMISVHENDKNLDLYSMYIEVCVANESLAHM